MLVQAFCSEFNNNEPVELWLKNSNEIFGFERSPDKRIKFIDILLDPGDLLKFYYDIDCLVFPSKAEGAGMPPREAMSTGLPVILTNWSGLADISNKKFNYPIEPVAIDEIEADFRKTSQPGNQARIDIKELMYWMRYVYEHQDEAKSKGKLASNWIKKEYNLDSCAKSILDVLIKNFNYK
jgi:glycosyltransferase involved in cell wall biosynthesis